MSSYINELVDGLKTSLSASNMAEIEVNKLLNSISECMDDLSNITYEYIKLYDDYEYNNTMDAELIKEKLKDTINKVIKDEI